MDSITITFTLADLLKAYDCALEDPKQGKVKKDVDYAACCVVAQGAKNVIPEFKRVTTNFVLSNHGVYWEPATARMKDELSLLIWSFDCQPSEKTEKLLPCTITFIKRETL